MKNYLILFISLFILCQTSWTQESKKGWLWKISGGDLTQPSYIYGVIESNRHEVFDLDMAVFDALSSCSLFCTENDCTKIDSIASRNMNESFFEGMNNIEEEANDDSKSNPFSYQRIIETDGKITTLSLYLLRVAKNLGLKYRGLTEYDPNISIKENYKDLNADIFTSYNSNLDALIEPYLSGDLKSYETELTLSEELQPDSCAAQFIRLASKEKTFAILDSHLFFGDNSILDQLKNSGHTIERVSYTGKTSKFEEAFNENKNIRWRTGNYKNIVEFQSPSHIEIANTGDFGSFHFFTEIDLGLMYMVFTGDKKIQPQTFLYQFLSTPTFGGDPDVEILDDVINGQLVYTAQAESNIFQTKMLVVDHPSMNIALACMSLTKEGLDHPHVEKVLHGFQTYDIPVLEFKKQRDPEKGFAYSFPDDIPFITSNVLHEEYSDRDSMLFAYKLYTDPSNGNEYLLRYGCLPSSILYINPDESLEMIHKEMRNSFHAQTVDSKDHYYLGLPVREEECKNIVSGNSFFIKTVLRGSLMYQIGHTSSAGQRDDSFFDAFEILHPNILENNTTFSFEDADFTIELPPDPLATFIENEEGGINKEFCFRYPQNGVNVNVQFERASPYGEFDLSPENMSRDSLAKYSQIDTNDITHWHYTKYKNTCPVLELKSIDKTSKLVHSERVIYCNKYITYLTIFMPADLTNSTLDEQIFSTFDFALNENSGTYFEEPQGSNIMKNLESKDTTIFNDAWMEFDNYELFEEKDRDALIALLNKDLLYDNDASTAKYSIISKLHEFQDSLTENSIADYFHKTENTIDKDRILQSLAYRYTENSTAQMLSLLEKMGTEQPYPYDIYAVFADSLELFEKFDQKVFALTEQNIAIDAFLQLAVHHMSFDTLYEFNEEQEKFIENKVFEKVDHYENNIAQDSSLSIEPYIMDYFLATDSPIKKDLYDVILHSHDLYGKYRIAYNDLQEAMIPDEKLVEELMEDKYYRYFVMYDFDVAGQKMEKKYRKKEDVCLAVIRNQTYDDTGYWCDDCEILKWLDPTDSKFGEMALARCFVDKTKNDYFIGLVGPFDAQDHFNLVKDESVYYTELKSIDDPLLFLPSLLEYLNSEETSK